MEALSKLAYTLGDTDYVIIFEEGGRSARLIVKFVPPCTLFHLCTVRTTYQFRLLHYRQSLVSQRLSSIFTFGSAKVSPYEAGAPGVTMIYRGYDEAYARSHPVAPENGEVKGKDSRDVIDSLPLGDGVNAPGPSVVQRDRDVPPLSPIAPGPDTPLTLRELPPPEDEYTDLILIVHGIGQGVRHSLSEVHYIDWGFTTLRRTAHSSIRVFQLCKF